MNDYPYATFRQWLNEFAAQTGHDAIAYVIGDNNDWRIRDNKARLTAGTLQQGDWPPIITKTVLTELPNDFLDHEFDDGFGTNGCPPMYAWNETHVFFVTTYDGSTRWDIVPRNPVVCAPEMPGG